MGNLQVSPDMDMRKITTPILLHMLRNELRFPLLFMLRCRLTVASFKKTIDPRFPKELIDLAALPLWVYINLNRRIGQKKAFEVMRVAILTGSIASWNFTYKAAEKERTFVNLCDAEIEVNKSGFTRWNTLEVVERSARRFEIKITRCLYHELTSSLGIPELTPVVAKSITQHSTHTCRTKPSSTATAPVIELLMAPKNASSCGNTGNERKKASLHLL